MISMALHSKPSSFPCSLCILVQPAWFQTVLTDRQTHFIGKVQHKWHPKPSSIPCSMCIHAPSTWSQTVSTDVQTCFIGKVRTSSIERPAWMAFKVYPRFLVYCAFMHHPPGPKQFPQTDRHVLLAKSKPGALKDQWEWHPKPSSFPCSWCIHEQPAWSQTVPTDRQTCFIGKVQTSSIER